MSFFNKIFVKGEKNKINSTDKDQNIYDKLNTKDPEYLYLIAKDIYFQLTEEERLYIDGSCVDYHSDKKYSIPSDKLVADELIIYPILLIRNGCYENGIKLFQKIIIHCSWLGHFSLQEVVPMLLKIDDEYIHDLAMYYATFDFFNRRIYMEKLKGCRFPVWEKLISQLIKEKNYNMALYIAEEAAREEVGSSWKNGYCGEIIKIKEFIKKESKKWGTRENIKNLLNYKNDFYIDYIYSLKKCLIENNLYESIELIEITEGKIVIYYHKIPLIGIKVLDEVTPCLFFDITKDNEYMGITPALEKIPNLIKCLKFELKEKLIYI